MFKESDLPEEIPEFTDRSTEPTTKRAKYSVKSLLKFRIQDLLAIPYDSTSDSFKLKHFDVSLVMCGGKITDVFQDDLIVSFEVSDGTGSIRCFRKFKLDPKQWLDNLQNAPSQIRFLQNTFINDDETFDNENTIFKSKIDETVLKNFENESKSTMNEVLFWFKNEIVERQKKLEVGDTVHIVGYLLEDKSAEFERKINVLDFRLVDNELDSEDLQAEIEYLHKFVYI